MRRRLRTHRLLSVVAAPLVILSLAAAPSTSQARPLTHWWQAKGNATDSVGTDNGKLSGVTFGRGASGGNDRAFVFDGAANQQVVFNRRGGNPGLGDFTFAFSVLTTATVAQALWEKRQACDSEGTSFWGFRMASDGEVGFEVQDLNGQNYVDPVSQAVVNDGLWHRVVVTRKGPTVRLFVDGIPQATRTSPSTADISNDTRLRAGVSACDFADGTHAFTGELDELKIYRKALGRAAIQNQLRPGADLARSHPVDRRRR